MDTKKFLENDARILKNVFQFETRLPAMPKNLSALLALMGMATDSTRAAELIHRIEMDACAANDFLEDSRRI